MPIVFKKKTQEPVQPVALTTTIPGRGNASITVPMPVPKGPPEPVAAPKSKIVFKIGPKAAQVAPEAPQASLQQLPKGSPLIKALVKTSKAPVLAQSDNGESLDNDLVAAGLADDTKPKYETLHVGQRVQIVKDLYPHVKHYRMGDVGTVRYISNNVDPMGMDDPGYRVHSVDIDQPVDKDRKGQSAGLFRHEIAPYKGEAK